MSGFPNKSLSGSTPKPNPVGAEILPLTHKVHFDLKGET